MELFLVNPSGDELVFAVIFTNLLAGIFLLILGINRVTMTVFECVPYDFLYCNEYFNKHYISKYFFEKYCTQNREYADIWLSNPNTDWIYRFFIILGIFIIVLMVGSILIFRHKRPGRIF
jgi:hypothetical protein